MPLHKVIMFAGAAFLAACVPPVKTFTGSSPAPVGDAFTCVIRELARLEYSAQNADRPAGFIKAEKQDTGTASWLAGASYFTEMSIPLVPVEGREGADIRITTTRTSQRSGAQRSSTGLVITEGAIKDSESIVSACGSAGTGASSL